MFVLADNALVSTLNLPTVAVQSQGGAAALFPIRPLVRGEITMSVKAKTGLRKLVVKILVKVQRG